MHVHAHVARVMGFASFSASLALLPHLSEHKRAAQFDFLEQGFNIMRASLQTV
jgi:hypothetical protein